jgi:hypothetical protein
MVVCEDKNWKIHEVPVDTMIFVMILKAREELVKKFKNIVPEVDVGGIVLV